MASSSGWAVKAAVRMAVLTLRRRDTCAMRDRAISWPGIPRYCPPAERRARPALDPASRAESETDKTSRLFDVKKLYV